MTTKEILNSHSISTLKKEISKTNIKGYSTMKKNEIINLMLKNKERFSHIKMNVKPKPTQRPTQRPKQRPTKKAVDKLVLKYIREIKKLPPQKKLQKIQDIYKKYEKKVYDFIKSYRDDTYEYEELIKYFDDKWSDKMADNIPDGRKKKS